MSSKGWFSWSLPFGDKCDPRCEQDLHNGWCFVFPVVFVVLTLALVGYLRMNQSWMLFSLIILWLFFGATWGFQRKLVVRYWCRKCLQAGGPVCPYCGEKIVIKKGYYVNHLLFVTFYIGMIGRCVKCGYRRVIESSTSEEETLKTLGLEEKQWKKLAKETF